MIETTSYDAVVIGGGPAGSTVATLLARQGLRVVVFEKKTFPRFHIGESLLPASLPIFEELGVQEQLKARFIKKGGGKFYFGQAPVYSDFSSAPRTASFAKTPNAYMVTREDLDDILLKNAASSGAEVHFQESVTDLIQQGKRVIGVIVEDAAGKNRHVHCDMVFDCSGFGAVIPKKFNLRRENRLKRMAVFGHYQTTPLDKDVKNGWIVAPMIYDGWMWMIPLKQDMVSVGIVIPVEEFKKAEQSPQEFLESYMKKEPVVKAGLSPNPQLQGKIHLYGNLGYTTSRAYGDGWVLVGDAAFFIDPCFSSGVHLALSSAKEAARCYLEARHSLRSPTEIFQAYEKVLRTDEKYVLRFVDAFYMASRNHVLRWLGPQCMRIFRSLGLYQTVDKAIGGDFSQNALTINIIFAFSKIISFLLPIRPQTEYQVKTMPLEGARFPRLFKFTNLPWLPDFLRNATTDYLNFIERVGRLYDPATPLLNTALDRMHETQVLDCGSGAGGPWLHLFEKLRKMHPGVQLQLCDYFPNEEARHFWKKAFDGKVAYVPDSIDAKNIPPDLKGFRTFFSSFHHFRPEQAHQILQDAVTKQTGIAIFEYTQRGVLSFLGMFLVPFVVWAVTPWIHPFSWKRLLFTYLLPVIPLMIAWDGLVSCLRTYSPKELKEQTHLLGGDYYDWQVGEVKGPLSPVPMTYLIGLPRRRLDRPKDKAVVGRKVPSPLASE